MKNLILKQLQTVKRKARDSKSHPAFGGNLGEWNVTEILLSFLSTFKFIRPSNWEIPKNSAPPRSQIQLYWIQ